MGNEYNARYQGHSHRELYDQLKAGNPNQVEQLASQWRAMAAAVDDLTAGLDRDLAGLQASWQGSASDEYRRRIGLVTTFARELSTEFSGTYEGLTLMAGPLRHAQAKVEHPDEADDHDKLLKGAGIGMLAGPGGAIVGGLIGHNQDKEEKERARQRTIQLVAEVAYHYDTTAPGRLPASVNPVPSDLPGAGSSVSATPESGPAVSAPGSAPSPGSGSGGSGAHTGPAGTPAPSPSAGVGSAPASVAASGPSGVIGAPVAGVSAADGQAGYGTSLAGAAGLGAWGLGAAGLVGAAGGSSRPNATATPGPTAQPAGALGGAAGGFAGGTPGHAVVGSRPGTITGAQSSSAAGGGATPGGRGAAAGHTVPGTAGRGAATRGTAPAAAIGRRTGEGEADNRLTWLIEDEVVWRDGDGPTAPVLDAERPDEARPEA